MSTSDKAEDRQSRAKSPARRTLSDRVVDWIRKELFAFALVSILAIIGIVLVWNHIAVTIPPGSVGVFYDRLFGGVRSAPVYREGLHFFFPWNKMYVYDCRVKQQTYSAEILAFGGMAITVDVSVRWRVIPNLAPSVHVNLGPEYPETVIRPVVHAAVRSVAGKQTPESLYALKPGEMQDQVLESIRETLGFGLRESVVVDEKLGLRGAGWKIPATSGENDTPPILITDAAILRVTLPDVINKSIDMKFSAAQRVIQERYKVLETVERYKAQYIDAAAVRRTQQLVNPGLNEDFLRLQGIKATLELAKSRNAKLVVMGGGKDGLPIILNPGSMDATTNAATDAAGAKKTSTLPAAGIPGVSEEFHWKGLRQDLASLDERLRELADIDIAAEIFDNPLNAKQRAMADMTGWGVETLGEPYLWPGSGIESGTQSGSRTGSKPGGSGKTPAPPAGDSAGADDSAAEGDGQ